MSAIQSILGVGWENRNALRNYPLTADATGQDVTGSFSLPNDVLVDLVLPLSNPLDYDPAGFHLMEVAVFGTGVMITIGYGGVYNGGWSPQPTRVAQASLAVASHSPNDSYRLQGVDAFEDALGSITVGELSTLLNSAGVYQFDQAGGRLVPTTVRPAVQGVSSLRLLQDGEASEPLRGDVELYAGTNMRLTPLELDNQGDPVDGGTDYNAIRIDAIDGAGLNEDCDCDNERDLPDPIRTINGVAADAQGNFTLQETECVKLTSDGEGRLRIEDVCSEPCCGSPELEKLSEDQERLNIDVRTLRNAVAQIETQMGRIEQALQAVEASGAVFINSP